MSQTTGNLYIARTNASDLGNYSCLATSHMDFSTKSVFSKFAQLNLAAEGQGQAGGRGELRGSVDVKKRGFPSELVKSSSQGTGSGPRPLASCYKTSDTCPRSPRGTGVQMELGLSCAEILAWEHLDRTPCI